MAKKRRRNVARDKILDQLIGRALLTSEAVRKEFMERLVDAIVDVGWNNEQGIIAVVRAHLTAYEPLLAEHLSNAMILTWLGGYIEQTKYLPTVVRRWMRDHAYWAQLPPEVPGIFGTGDKSPPAVRFPRIEKATESLFNRGLMTRPQYDRLSAAAKQATFTVAWIDDTKVIGKIRDALAEATAEGPTLDVFRRNVVEKLEKSPMSAWHSETVYRTNLMSAYRDGKESLMQHPIVQEVFPFRQYFATHDGRVRDEHLALETLGIQGTGIYYNEDPMWDLFSVPWDYNCRCITVPMRIADAARAGIKEAQEWLRTGVKPANPTYCLAKIPFRPKEGFGVRHGPLLSVGTSSSVRMSSQPIRLGDANPWVPYRGPRGGQGWRNSQTGFVAYQVDRPGAHEAGSKEEAETAKPAQVQPVKPARPHVTDTPEFKSWFGGSKVTGDDGKPMVVYHGTGVDIEEFNTGVAWVSQSPELANEYAAHREVFDKQAPNVMPLYVKAESPWSYNGAKHASIHTMMGRALSDAKQAGHKIDMPAAREAYKAVDKHWEKIGLDDSEVVAHTHWNKSGKEGAALLGRFLQQLGYDSISFTESGHETFGVFSPSQLKSATGNRGTFNPSNPNIRMGADNPWAPYKGPRGGTGWQHSGTGDVRYVKDRPGAHETGGSAQRGVHGVSALPVQGPHKPGGVVQDPQQRPADASQTLPEGARSRVGQDVSGVVSNQGTETAIASAERAKQLGIAKDVYYGNIHPDAAKHITNTLEFLTSEYGGALSGVRAVSAEQFQKEFGAGTGPDVAMGVRTAGGGINVLVLNEDALKSKEAFQKFKDRIGTDHIAAGANLPGMLAHEYGHALAYKSGIDLEPIFDEYLAEEGRISGRSSYDPEEMAAEAFAYMHSGGELKGALAKLLPAFSKVRSKETGGSDASKPHTVAAEHDPSAPPVAGQHVTETPEFKRWFGDSKVVGKDGKPLRVFHGSGREIVGAFGERTTFFTTDSTQAGRYAKRDNQSRIYPAYLKIENPAQVTFEQFLHAAEGMIQRLKNEGHDGMMVRVPKSPILKDNDATWYVAFSPNQIKSAIGNQGTFDPDDPDIRMTAEP